MEKHRRRDADALLHAAGELKGAGIQNPLPVFKAELFQLNPAHGR